MEPGAKVKLRGVEIGQVDPSIGADAPADHPRPASIPNRSDTTCRAMSKRRSSPARHSAQNTSTWWCPTPASAPPLKPGAVLKSRNVTAEVNTVFENLQSIVTA